MKCFLILDCLISICCLLLGVLHLKQLGSLFEQFPPINVECREDVECHLVHSLGLRWWLNLLIFYFFLLVLQFIQNCHQTYQMLKQINYPFEKFTVRSNGQYHIFFENEQDIIGAAITLATIILFCHIDYKRETAYFYVISILLQICHLMLNVVNYTEFRARK